MSDYKDESSVEYREALQEMEQAVKKVLEVWDKEHDEPPTVMTHFLVLTAQIGFREDGRRNHSVGRWASYDTPISHWQELGLLEYTTQVVRAEVVESGGFWSGGE